VTKIARTIRLRPAISEASRGQCRPDAAVDAFEPEKGFRFATTPCVDQGGDPGYILRSWSLEDGTTANQKKVFFNLRRPE